MKKISLGILAFLVAAILYSCNSGGYKKLKGGLEFKIVSDGKGAKIQYGQVMKYYLTQKYKDSVLKDTRNQPPMYQPLDTMQLDHEYYQVFKDARAGDSIVVRILVDSVMKSGPGMMPPQFKKGEYFFTIVKVVGVLKADQAQTDFKEEVRKFQVADSIRSIGQLVKDDQLLQDYMTKNNIKGTKSDKGTYVQIETPGTGPNAQDGQILLVKYRGKTLDGKTFDSNMDSTSRTKEPYTVVLGTSRVIKGWDDGLKMFNKGSKGKLLVPSVLAYGAAGSQSGIIGPNAELVFDIEVVDIRDVPNQTPPAVVKPTESDPSKGKAKGK